MVVTHYNVGYCSISGKNSGDKPMDSMANLLRAVIVYTDPTFTKKLAEDCLGFYKVPFSYIRDENGNITDILFETSILNLETHEISEIH